MKYFTNWLCRILAGLYSGGTVGISQGVKNSYEPNRGKAHTFLQQKPCALTSNR
jgi:hypothetical protein